MATLNFAIIGCGGVTLQNHLPGLRMCPNVRLVALCNADLARQDRARQQTGVAIISTDYEDIVKRDDVHARAMAEAGDQANVRHMTAFSAQAQAVMDAALRSAATRQWVDL